MWIAFKKLYLWYSEQQVQWYIVEARRCELLSKNCIFDILNNIGKRPIVCILLWIAFKKLYLWYSEQLWRKRTLKHARCELLSKNCIFDILNNNLSAQMAVQMVVNCFQKIVSLIFWTTTRYASTCEVCCELLSKNCIFDILNNRKKSFLIKDSLWIAFKKLYLWYSEQLRLSFYFVNVCCELLSKNCIFDILNNH